MKNFLCVVFLCLMVKIVLAQPNISPTLADSLKQELAKAKEDTTKVLILEKLTRCYTAIDLNMALRYGRQGKALAEQIGYMEGRLLCTIALGFIMARTNDHAEGLQILMEAKQFCEKQNKYEELARILTSISTIYSFNKDYEKALEYAKEAQKIQSKHHISEGANPINLGLGTIYQDMGMSDSAIVYLQKAYEIGMKFKMPTYVTSSTYYLGMTYAQLGKTDMALAYFRKSLDYSRQFNTNYTISRTYQGLAEIYKKKGQLDSTIFYCKKALSEKDANVYYLITVTDASTLLADVYEQKNNPVEALKYYKMATAARDSLFAREKTRQIEKLAYEEKEREARTQRRIEAHKQDLQNQIKIYALSGVLGAVLIFAFFLYRNNRQKHRANALLHRQKEEIHHEREKAEKALTELKAAQDQLIQSEKLASLGELTAGIAHEIQNPLNFVNNFSDVSIELIEEAPKPPMGASEDWIPTEIPFGGWGAFLDDLKQNLQKINHHGKRASSIVKGMLEHSRASSGQKELTDINQLVDEFLRLSYHGLRAKDKSFNADFKANLDPNLPKINVIPQDIGRVLLNLINNAFYATNAVRVQNLNLKNSNKQNLEAYKPSVTVTTKATGNQIMICIADNGTGMSEDTKAKIFQPFFTTKPTGEGTGLGLSLAYDIITKGHAGTIEVDSVEGQGTTFTIRIPV
jgi:two-component system, NtrC family, sensor kinase